MKRNDTVCNNSHLLFDPGPDLTPVTPTHPGQARGFTTCVPRHCGELVGRYVELVLTGVLDEEIVSLDTRDLSVDQASEAPYAVMMVHNEIAWIEIAISISCLSSRPATGGSVGSPAACNLAFAYDTEPKCGENEPVVDPDGDDRRTLCFQGVDNRKVRAVVGQHGCNTLCSCDAIHCNDDVDRPALPPVNGRRNGLRIPRNGVKAPHLIALIVGTHGVRWSLNDPTGHRLEVEREIQRRMFSRVGATTPPRISECLSQICLLADQVDGSFGTPRHVEDNDRSLALAKCCFWFHNPRKPRFHALERHSGCHLVPPLRCPRSVVE